MDTINITIGFKFSVLYGGDNIGNDLEVTSFNEQKDGVFVKSLMLDKIMEKPFRIVDLIRHIEMGEIEIL